LNKDDTLSSEEIGKGCSTESGKSAAKSFFKTSSESEFDHFHCEGERER